MKRIQTASTPKALRKTLQFIGQAINNGGEYVPIRQYAAELASKAGPRDFLGQVREIYDDFTKNRWRYVFDPVGVELLAYTGPVIYDTVLGFGVKPPARGFGDCDDATVALGAVLQSVGFPVRIVTIAKPGARNLFDHVYPQVKIPKFGWVSVDAVGYPQRDMGWNAPASRAAIWDTTGNLKGFKGVLPGVLNAAFKAMTAASLGGVETEEKMSFAGVSYHDSRFKDYGLENYGLAGTDLDEPETWTNYGLINFGAQIDRPMPMTNGDQLNLAMEYDDDDTVGYAGGQPLVRTKMLEMDPNEVLYARRTGRPRLGAVALGDDGDIYQWAEVPGYGGFFKKLRKKIRKGVKKAVKGIHRGVTKATRKLIKKLPGGKYLIKVYDKVKKVAMKVVKPLTALVGKAARRLAPIAALIPGYGPVVAAAMYKAGKIAKIMNELAIETDKKGRPKFKSGEQAKALRKALAKSAKKMGKVKKADLPYIRSGKLLKKGSRRHKAKLNGLGLVDV